MFFWIIEIICLFLNDCGWAVGVKPVWLTSVERVFSNTKILFIYYVSAYFCCIKLKFWVLFFAEAVTNIKFYFCLIFISFFFSFALILIVNFRVT